MRMLIDNIPMAVYQDKRGHWYGTWRDETRERHTRYFGAMKPDGAFLTNRKHVFLRTRTLKYCLDCGAVLPLADRHTGGNNRVRCVACRELHRAEMRRQNARTWRKKNRERDLAYKRQWRAKRKMESA